jgi:hypothetical protein
MGRSVRGRVLVGVLLAGAIALLGLSGCGRFADRSADDSAADMTDLSWDEQALEAIGFASEDVSANGLAPAAEPAPSASAGAKARDGRHPKVRRLRLAAFGRHLEHGEAVVQTEEGTKTVVVQRGTVTAINATTITVKSADGFTLTWTFGSPIHVMQHRTQIQPSAIAVGAQVGVAGEKVGSTPTARLIALPTAK